MKGLCYKKILGVLLLFAVLLSACKSEFEKIRTSGDPELLLQKADEYYAEEEYQRAQTLYELIIGSYRGKKELEQIYYNYAYTYYHMQRFILASYYFSNFTTTFPTSQYREEMEFMSAYSNYQLSPTFRLDQTYTNDAIQEFQAFINRYPDSERVEEANKLIDRMRAKLELKAFKTGELYFNLRQYQAAIQSLENLLKDFPDTKSPQEIRYLIVRSAYLLAENSVITKQRERYEDALEYSELFLRKYPQSDYYNDVNIISKKVSEKLKNIEGDERYQDQSAGIGS